MTERGEVQRVEVEPGGVEPGEIRQGDVFGAAADEYDAIRPGYPPALVADLLAEAGPGPVLEVGAGTGKATTAFAAYGIELLALEPDPRMAAVLASKVADLKNVAVVVDRFETWPPDRGHGLLYSAQAWHWLDPDRRNDLAWAALAPGGLLALFWNGFLLADPALHAALREADRGVFPGGEHTAHAWSIEGFPVKEVPFAEEWEQLGLHDDERFTEARGRHYRWTRIYSADEYARYLATTSLYLLLEPDALADALAAVRETIGRHGGVIEIVMDTALATVRRR
jgi:SAM-dependent methyltransferase